MTTWLHDILTGIDGTSYSVAKVVGVALTITYIGLSVASFVMGKPFDMVLFGTGAGLVVTAMGAAIKLAETSEPKEGK